MTLTLRPYQEVGISWLLTKRHAMLLDGMRLGKTPQALVAAARMGARKVQVVCPAIVRLQWLKEARRWTPDVTIMATSYDMARQPDVSAHIQAWRPDVLVVDEAHYAKNPATARTQALYGSGCKPYGGLAGAAGVVWLLSGTLAPNDATEVWPHLHALFGEKLSQVAFARRYCAYEDKYIRVRGRLRRFQKIVGYKDSMFEELREKIRAVSLRRRLQDVYPDLPPLQVNEVLMDVSEATQEEDGGLHQRIGLSKVPAVLELAEGMLQEQGKLAIFAWHIAVLDRLETELMARGVTVVRIDGSTSAKNREEAIARFQEDERVQVFLGQIEAAGTGIPLHAATAAIFAELPWTPDDILQPAMRIFSVDQTAPKEVVLCVAAGTRDTVKSAEVLRRAQDFDSLFNT